MSDAGSAAAVEEAGRPSPDDAADEALLPTARDDDASRDADAADADADEGEASCNGVIPRANCSYTGPSSPPFDLEACGLVPDGPDAGEAGVTASEFCLEQNPMFRAPFNSTRAMPASPVAADASGGVYVCVCGSGVPGGRAPEGLDLAPRPVRSLGDFFAASAEAEAASIDGFEILAAELSAHGAPRSLLRACRRAASDERRHASVMTGFAATYGARPRPTPVARGPVRSLEAVARENAVVGCVVETFAALVAQWQAEHATDEGIAEAMKTIARDEARHAALAWRVHEWLGAQLSRAARARVDDAMLAALDAIAAEIQPNTFENRAVAGLPTEREGRALALALAATLVPIAAAA